MAGPSIGEAEWKAHAELVGRVTLGWSHNVHQVFRVFLHLTGLDPTLAQTIFFSHQSDKGQRRMVAAVADAVEVDKLHRKSLNKLFDRLEKAGTGRNLAAHTIFGVSLFDPRTGAWGATVVPEIVHDRRLEADFRTQFQRVDRELHAIYKALDEWLQHTPIPDRPWGSPPFLGYVPPEAPLDPSASDDPTDWPV